MGPFFWKPPYIVDDMVSKLWQLSLTPLTAIQSDLYCPIDDASTRIPDLGAQIWDAYVDVAVSINWGSFW